MRPETGVMKFDDDWPGIFIRGDNAAYYNLNLQYIMNYIESGKKITDPFVINAISDLQELLSSCNVIKQPKIQVVKLRNE